MIEAPTHRMTHYEHDQLRMLTIQYFMDAQRIYASPLFITDVLLGELKRQFLDARYSNAMRKSVLEAIRELAT